MLSDLASIVVVTDVFNRDSTLAPSAGPRYASFDVDHSAMQVEIERTDGVIDRITTGSGADVRYSYLFGRPTSDAEEVRAALGSFNAERAQVLADDPSYRWTHTLWIVDSSMDVQPSDVVYCDQVPISDHATMSADSGLTTVVLDAWSTASSVRTVDQVLIGHALAQALAIKRDAVERHLLTIQAMNLATMQRSRSSLQALRQCISNTEQTVLELYLHRQRYLTGAQGLRRKVAVHTYAAWYGDADQQLVPVLDLARSTANTISDELGQRSRQVLVVVASMLTTISLLSLISDVLWFANSELVDPGSRSSGRHNYLLQWAQQVDPGGVLMVCVVLLGLVTCFLAVMDMRSRQ